MSREKIHTFTAVESASVVISIEEANTAGWVSQYAYAWDTTSYQYAPITPDDLSNADTISVWQGFWTVKLDVAPPCTLLVPPTEITPKAAPARPQWLNDHLGKENPHLPLQLDESWFLQLVVQSETGYPRDTYSGVGVAPDALAGYDRHDAFEFTPAVSYFVQLYFPHHDPGDTENYWSDQPYRYTYDIRDTELTQPEWKFYVYQYGAPGDYRLSGLGFRLIPQTILLSLHDDAGMVLVDDLRQVREYSFNLSAQNTYRCFRVRAEIVEDNTLPNFTIGITQNPILTDDLDIYVLPSEELINIQTEVNGDELDIMEIDPANIVYQGDYELEESGSLTIHVSGEDASGNVGEDTTVISVQLIRAVAGGTIHSPDGRLTLVLPNNALPGDKYLTVFSEEGKGWGGLTPVGPCYRINPRMNLLTEAILSLGYQDEEVYGLYERKLCIYFKDGSRWVPIPGEVREGENRVTARVNKLGIYRLFYNPEGVVTSPLPESYTLDQNYPNPFNASTLIRYQLPKAGRVSLKIYNIRGQEVKTLVDKSQAPGHYSVVWNGKNRFGQPVSSGIYFYRFQSPKFTTSKKMILIK